MEYIERPKEVNKSEAGVQSSEYIQKNMQGQLNNIYDYLDNLVDNKEEYSTDEIRIGTWIDGSAIYRKVIACNTGTLTSSWRKLVDAPTNISKLIKIRGIWTQFNFPIYLSSEYHIAFRYNQNEIDVIGGSGFDNKDIYLIIDYTKGG